MLGSNGTFRKQKKLCWHKPALTPASGVTSPEGRVTRLPGLPPPDPEGLAGLVGCSCFLWAFQAAPGVRNLPANAGRHQRQGFDPWVGKIPWRRAWQPAPVLLPGESHGQTSLAGHSPWGHKESDMTERLHTHAHACNTAGPQ